MKTKDFPLTLREILHGLEVNRTLREKNKTRNRMLRFFGCIDKTKGGIREYATDNEREWPDGILRLWNGLSQGSTKGGAKGIIMKSDIIARMHKPSCDTFRNHTCTHARPKELTLSLRGCAPCIYLRYDMCYNDIHAIRRIFVVKI